MGDDASGLHHHLYRPARRMGTPSTSRTSPPKLQQYTPSRHSTTQTLAESGDLIAVLFDDGRHSPAFARCSWGLGGFKRAAWETYYPAFVATPHIALSTLYDSCDRYSPTLPPTTLLLHQHDHADTSIANTIHRILVIGHPSTGHTSSIQLAPTPTVAHSHLVPARHTTYCGADTTSFCTTQAALLLHVLRLPVKDSLPPALILLHSRHSAAGPSRTR